jgi:putative AlgH/UPF0301 family transcriptional regulator
MKLRTLLFAVLAAAATAAQAGDLSKSMILVATPEVVDQLYGSTILVVFALVERKQSPGGQSFELMPGLYAAVDEETVDRIIRTESDHARFVAGLVVWQRGELRAEIERGAWYVLPPDAHLAVRKPSQGLWEELVRISKLRANRV